jgi:SET domain-containing protein
VGVFAIKNIRKGADIFGEDDDEIVWIERSQLRWLSREVRRLYEDFSIITDRGRRYGCPANFNRLTISWYLNSSTNPNVACDKDFRFIAKRHIKAGEELTVDYSTYNEFH